MVQRHKLSNQGWEQDLLGSYYCTSQKHMLGIYATCLYQKGKAACGESYAFQCLPYS